VNSFARAARGWLAAAAVAGGALAFGLAAHAQGTEPPPDFGTPPSGEIPILFNDHHVYARPSSLQHGRTLVAIVRKNTIMVPLRSMFEQVGASVSYDPSTRTVDVSKPGADVKVSVGKAWVVINGQERPLDVPPEIYRGSIIVPLRVISEGMGAYVQWIAEKHLVSVRYVEEAPPVPPATPPPTPRPTSVPTVLPVPTAAASAKARVYEHYVAGDYMIAPKVYNELSPGNTGNSSFEVKGAVELPLLVSARFEFRFGRMRAGERGVRHLPRDGFRFPARLVPVCRPRLRNDGRLPAHAGAKRLGSSVRHGV
jgi:hypothetical protein